MMKRQVYGNFIYVYIGHLGKHLMRLPKYRGVFVYVSINPIKLLYMKVVPHRMTLL